MPCELVSLADVAPIPEPDETGSTFWENARIKALAYAAGSGLIAVAEDSGLVIDAMDGEPGVLSARFMGASTPYPERFKEIFRRIDGRDRAARFVTALAVARGNDDPLRDRDDDRRRDRARGRRRARLWLRSDLLVSAVSSARPRNFPIREKAIVSHRARAFRDLRRHLATRTDLSAL